MIKKPINIKKIDQKYLFDFLSSYPKTSSGRKNYSVHYKRILKNIFLSKIYSKNKILKKNFFVLNLID